MTARASYLKRVYGITEEQYAELLAAQGGGCAICSKTVADEGQALAVDHDHKSGRIRGLLCRYCNHRVVGRHRDSDLLRRMADYIDGGPDWYVPPKPKRRRKARKVK